MILIGSTCAFGFTFNDAQLIMCMAIMFIQLASCIVVEFSIKTNVHERFYRLETTTTPNPQMLTTDQTFYLGSLDDLEIPI